jgi:hypothetical protein
MQTETQLTARLTKCWRAMGAEVLNVTGSVFQASGWPDIFICHKHWTGWIEFKGPTTVIQPHQKRIIHTIGLTQSIFLVRFLYQEGDTWRYEVLDSNLIRLREFAQSGTDGQVAASMLKELKGLEP